MCTACTLLLAVLSVAVSATNLQQDVQVVDAAAKTGQAGAPRGPQARGKRRGSVFKFRTNKNAAEVFQHIDKEHDAKLLERIMRNSGVKGSRAKLATACTTV